MAQRHLAPRTASRSWSRTRSAFGLPFLLIEGCHRMNAVPYMYSALGQGPWHCHYRQCGTALDPLANQVDGPGGIARHGP
ncbi:hypothetical protein PR001_g12344 [Phytophthora rubi]|uniref:Uncharacterized protein n=1 Tax=Phytophthora rubi TaxID=129364 RepID=A0A6A3LND4_9STRA|nr:hypothetical protein PR002_g12669 [Phytophthora rubi]KAE9025783.1 hypothetical protein PR001_g12344 [Phytophthora rubi]